VSTVAAHQPPPAAPERNGHARPPAARRTLSALQYLDLSDCPSLEDAGLKMAVENCPNLLYLFARRCQAVTGEGEK